mgnify:CR=1 FL=1
MKIIHILFLALLVLSGCNKSQVSEVDTKEQAENHESEAGENRVELTAEQYKNSKIELGEVTLRNLSNVITATGKIDIPPSNLVSISAPLGGFVRKTELLQGMKVRKGQVLAVIENPDFIPIQQEYLETKIELEYAELEFERQKELSTENVGSQKIFQQATSKVKTLKARLAGLKERIRTAGINLGTLEKGTVVNHANIISPISGSVTVVNVNLGMYVSPTDVMFEIVDTDHLHVELSVFEKDISQVKIGQSVRFKVNNTLGKEGLAKVYLINPKINEDRTVRVHCHLETDDATLLPENYVNATIELGINSVPSLPDQAVVTFEGKSYVFVEKEKEVENGKTLSVFEMIEVQRGVSENGYTAITLPENSTAAPSKMVVNGTYDLLSKLKNSEEEGGGHGH